MTRPRASDATLPLEGGATFPFRHRLFRAIWNIVWLVLASWTPPPMHGWRRFLLRSFGADIHQTAGVYGSAVIWYPPNLGVGAHAYIGPGAQIYCMAPIRLDAYALVSQGAHLCAGTHDVDDPDFPLQVRPIQIGRQAWIAAEAFVGPGVTVGDGAVLGARSVAMKNLDPWTIYSGNPAQLLRRRNRESVESRYLQGKEPANAST